MSGEGLVQATRLAIVDGATQITMTQQAVASGARELIFSRDVYESPDDFQSFINRTHWDGSRRWELIGPMSPQEYEWMQRGIVATGPRRRFRQFGRGANNFYIWPAPTSLDSPAVLSFEYSSANWATGADGTTKPLMTSDSDTNVFPDDLMVMGAKWLWMQAKGFDYAGLRQDWMDQVTTSMSQDGGARTVNMAVSAWPILIGPGNVPDTGFGNAGP
jgi:hypothetical protein